jgi:putative transposase
MTRKQDSAKRADWKELMAGQEDFLRPLIQEVVRQVLEAEMEEAVGAEKGERTPNRQGYRAGYYGRTLVTRVGKLELRVPQDRQGRFRTEVFERYQRSEKALVGALTEMYVQGVSTRKVKAYLILDARYEKVREDGVIRSQAVMIAIGVDWEGRRNVLAVELAHRESQSSWKEFCLQLKTRGLSGVELVISDDHAGLRKAIGEVFPEAAWQRCYVHFLRNALDYLPRNANNDCMTELRWIYDRRSIEEARQDLAAWLRKWAAQYPKLCDWVEGNIEETLTFYRLPRQHHKNLKSTNLLERLNEEIKRRTLVVRIFPNVAACLRLVRALAVEMHENWIEATRYLNMEYLKEHKKELMRQAA